MFHKIPLSKILKGKLLNIGELQDLLLMELSRSFDFILHGGTAVWRVYGGKRFSYDVDIYYSNPRDLSDYFYSTKIFNILKSKITPSKILYLKIGNNDTVIELEASPTPTRIETIEANFWLVDGSSMVVITLTPEHLLREKVKAFINRRSAKDLYDIFYLIDLCDKNKIGKDLDELFPFLNSEPKDFPGLSDLILIGKPPSFEMIVRRIKKYAAG